MLELANVYGGDLLDFMKKCRKLQKKVFGQLIFEERSWST
jgi:hypothetical protein